MRSARPALGSRVWQQREEFAQMKSASERDMRHTLMACRFRLISGAHADACCLHRVGLRAPGLLAGSVGSERHKRSQRHEGHDAGDCLRRCVAIAAKHAMALSSVACRNAPRAEPSIECRYTHSELFDCLRLTCTALAACCEPCRGSTNRSPHDEAADAAAGLTELDSDAVRANNIELSSLVPCTATS